MWLIVVGAVVAVGALCSCSHGRKGQMKNAKNTPIVISGGSITGHTKHRKDWFLPNGAGTCPTDGVSGSQTCWGDAVTPVAVVTSANFVDDKTGEYLNQSLSNPNWQVVVTGTNGSDNPSLTIAPVSGCSIDHPDGCELSFAISNSSRAHFGPRHKKIEGIFNPLNPHHGRSVCAAGADPCGQYHFKTMTVSIAGTQVASATCRQSDSCLVCFTDSSANTSACKLK